MSTTALCVYCEQLAEQHASKSARTMRCPLCKTELGISASGAKFRLTHEDGHVAPSRHGKLIALAVGFGVCCLIALAAILLARFGTATPSKTEQQTPALIAPTPPPGLPATLEPGPNNANTKPATSRMQAGVAKAGPTTLKVPAQLPRLAPMPPGSIPVTRSYLHNVLDETEQRAQLRMAPELSLFAAPAKNLSVAEAQKQIRDRGREIRAKKLQ
jgi:hypothetical protein